MPNHANCTFPRFQIQTRSSGTWYNYGQETPSAPYIKETIDSIGGPNERIRILMISEVTIEDSLIEWNKTK